MTARLILIIFLFGIFLIPYGVVGSGGAILISISLSLAVTVLYNGPKFSAQVLSWLYPWLVCTLLLIFVNTLSAMGGIPFNYAEVADPIIYVNYMLLGLGVFAIYKQNPVVMQSTIEKVIVWLAVPTFASSFVALLGNSFALDFTMLFSTGEVYSKGYAQFRAFGLVGQPGKLGFFCAIASGYLLYLYFEKKQVKFAVGSVLYFLSMFSSFSRISFVCWLVLVFYLIFDFLSVYKKLAFSTFIIVGVSYFIAENQELVEFLLRGIDLNNFELATLGHRFVLKAWVFDFLSDDLVKLMFGIGSPKEYLGQFSHPYASDLTLRHPDSSQTLFLLRFGVIGSAFVYLLLLHWIWSTRGNRVVFKINVIYLCFSLLDPTYHDLKIVFLLICISACSLRGSK